MTVALLAAWAGLQLAGGLGSAPGDTGKLGGPATAGVFGIPTERVAERSARAEDLLDARSALHTAVLAYSSEVRPRRLAALDEQLRGEGLYCVPARVTDVRTGGGAERMRLSAGAAQGVVREAMALDFRGLVGLVVRVERDSCEVMLLTDPLCAVPVAAVPEESWTPPAAGSPGVRTPRGAVVGGYPSGLLRLTYLEGDEAPTPGALVVTSGQGTIYPAGFQVGRVVGHPVASERLVSPYADVKPSMDWTSLREVVLACRPPEGTAVR
jgi:cell shape-determining protein MreC